MTEERFDGTCGYPGCLRRSGSKLEKAQKFGIAIFSETKILGDS